MVPQDLPRVDHYIIEHALWVDPKAKQVCQGLRKVSPEQAEAAKEEVLKLLKASVIRGVIHSEWLSNPVLVKKHNGKWGMCIDLTHIDQLVDSTTGCELLNFLDAYSRYHQVWMAMEDERKTSFITPFGLYYYIWRPFSLRNIGAIFSSLVHKIL